MPNSLEINPTSRRAAAIGTVDASANNSRASVISAKACTVLLSMLTPTIPQLELPSRKPATRNTNGALEVERRQWFRQNRPEKHDTRQGQDRGFAHRIDAPPSRGGVAPCRTLHALVRAMLPCTERSGSSRGRASDDCGLAVGSTRLQLKSRGERWRIAHRG